MVLACGLAAQPAVAAAGKLSLDVDGIRRTAIIVEHSRLKRTRRPLVIVLHGSAGDSARVRRNLGLDDIFGDNGSVLVFPDAHDGHWALTGKANADDGAFFRALIAKLAAQGLVDSRRVFLVGVSAGGMLAMKLACSEPATYAGVATLIASLPKDVAATCQPAKPVPILMVNGTADARVPWLGGATTNIDQVDMVASSDETLAVFAKAAACGEPAKEIAFTSRSPKTRAFLDRFSNCKVPVERVRIEGGGHSIPGRRGGIDPAVPAAAQNTDFDSARLIYDFFKKLSAPKAPNSRDEE